MAEAKTEEKPTKAADKEAAKLEAESEVQLQGASADVPEDWEPGNNFHYFAPKGNVRAALSENGEEYTVVELVDDEQKVTVVPAEEFDAKYDVVTPAKAQ